MARVSLLSRFSTVADSRPVPLPWDFAQGIVFVIGRAGRDAHAKWQREQILKNPVQVARIEAAAKAGAIAAATNTDNAASTAADFARRSIETLAFPAAELLADTTDEEIAGVVDNFLLGWSGMTDAETGADVPFSREAAIELLHAQEWVAAGMPYSGTGPQFVVPPEVVGAVALAKYREEKTKEWQDAGHKGDGQQLGHALRQFIVFEANRSELYRASTIEAAARNLEPSSVGA
jgi:hypothetical protein